MPCIKAKLLHRWQFGVAVGLGAILGAGLLFLDTMWCSYLMALATGLNQYRTVRIETASFLIWRDLMRFPIVGLPVVSVGSILGGVTVFCWLHAGSEARPGAEARPGRRVCSVLVGGVLIGLMVWRGCMWLMLSGPFQPIGLVLYTLFDPGLIWALALCCWVHRRGD